MMAVVVWGQLHKPFTTHCCVFPNVTRSGIDSPDAKSAKVRPSSSLAFLGRDEDASGGVATVVARDRDSSTERLMVDGECGSLLVIIVLVRVWE